MDVLQFINLISNLIIAISTLLLYIFVFGIDYSPVHRLQAVHSYSLKFVFALTCAAASWNFWDYLAHFDEYEMHPAHILMHVCLATMISWAAIIHRTRVLPPRRRM